MRDESVLNRQFLRLPGGRWRASDEVHVECDGDGYCVVVRPKAGDEFKLRAKNPAEATSRALHLVVAGVVNPNAPKAPDRRGKRRANPSLRYPNPATSRSCGPDSPRRRNFVVAPRGGDDDDPGDERERWRRRAMEMLTAAFGAPTGGNADWSVTAWFVAGEGGTPNRSRPDIRPELYTTRSVWVVDDEDDYFSVVIREFRDDDNDDIEELFTATPENIEAIIAQARFHAARLITDYEMPPRRRGRRG
jgi:hypothetical protein